MSGRSIHEEKKMWINPYDRNRWALILIQMVTLVIAGNSWDRLSDGHIYSIPLVVLRIILLTIVLYSIAVTGQGSLRGILFIIFYYISMAISVGFGNHSSDIPGSIWIFLALCFLGLAVFAGIVAIVYSRDRKGTTKELIHCFVRSA